MAALDATVNAWMESCAPRIRHVCQSMRGEHILLSFVYEDTQELEQRIAVQTQKNPTPRFFDEDFLEEHPTNPRIPATPPPMH